MNVISGLPRSGSTLLCNILNQNPKNFASDTSVLAGGVNGLLINLSEQLEIQDVDYARIKTATTAFIDSWYDKKDKVIFDKGRLWTQMGLEAQELGIHQYVLVRDLRDIYASMEKAHRQTPLVHSSALIPTTDMHERADKMFSPEGMVGSCMRGVEDLIRRNLPNVTFIQYEALCTDPERVLAQIDDFKYDFKKVKNVSHENDKSYHNKYPHKGEGEVNTKSIGTWKGIINDELAQLIKEKFPLYNRTFGY